MKDWKDRLQEEYTEVNTRKRALQDFLAVPENSAKMHPTDWNLLVTQRDVMHAYVSILQTRMCNHDIVYDDED